MVPPSQTLEPAPAVLSLVGWRHVPVNALGDLDSLVEQIEGELHAYRYSPHDIFALRLALQEAVVNAIKHGHHGDANKEVRVYFRVNEREALVHVEDQGQGFDPNDVADPLAPENLERPSGRGVFLMRCYLTWVRYNERGNAVTLCRSRSEAISA